MPIPILFLNHLISLHLHPLLQLLLHLELTSFSQSTPCSSIERHEDSLSKSASAADHTHQIADAIFRDGLHLGWGVLYKIMTP